MKLRTVASEAVRNVATGMSRVALFATAIAALVFCAGFFELTTIESLVTSADQYHDSGGATYVISADHGVSGAACDRLGSLGGVEAAGALRTDNVKLNVSTAPGTPLPQLDVTPSFLQLLHVHRRGEASGITVSADAAKSLLADGASTLPLAGGKHVNVAGTYDWPDDGRLQALAYAALTPSPENGSYDQCWMTVWPQNAATADLLSSALTPTASGSDNSSAAISQVNVNLGKTFAGPAAFATRPSAPAALVAAALAVILGIVSVRLRRLELTSARHCGMSRTALVTQMLIETLLWSTAGCLGAGAALAALIVQHRSDATTLVTACGRCLFGVELALIASVVLSAATIRSSNVLRYFRDR